ncbi:hypothetical protein Hdeb2414_s0003g00102051 [Helianthus debilis subsp. tardiflorus]
MVVFMFRFVADQISSPSQLGSTHSNQSTTVNWPALVRVRFVSVSEYAVWFSLSGSVSGLGQNRSTKVKWVNTGQRNQPVRRSQLKDPEYYRCTLATSHSWNDTTESR